LTLLAQLAALPPDQRAALVKLLDPPTTLKTTVGLDDSRPSGFEQPKGEAG
jgi:hypothetical protein